MKTLSPLRERKTRPGRLAAAVVVLVAAQAAPATAGDLRPSNVAPPIVVVPSGQAAPRLPDESFYQDFARRAAKLTPPQQAELSTQLRNLAQAAKDSGRYADSAHYYRLLDSVNAVRK